ncbi:MAG: DUF3857 domain-containing protein [Chitinophagaceae bacterium]|nr:DUF3857 domain-containing protein [Chitinophagaceae bacterium]
MRKFIVTLSVLGISTLSFAQKKIPVFGEIDLSELQLKSCSFEPEATAMKLFDIQEVDFSISSGGSRIKTERRVRIKIFSEKGFEHASIRVPYFSKRGVAKIKQMHAVIYNLDTSGKVIKQELDKKDFFKEKAAENVGIINFTFPGLKAGSVIEYSYTRIENDILQLSPWLIQDEIPVLYTSAIIEAPVELKIEKKLWGTDTIGQKISLVRSENFRRTTFFKDSINSFSPEPFMSSHKDNLMRVSFLLLPHTGLFTNVLTNPKFVWRFTGNSLMSSRSFGEQIKKMIPGTERLIDSAKAMASVKDKIIFIYGSVKKRIPEKGEQTYHPNDLEEAWSTRNGNTAEINLILLNLLQKSGVKAYPLLVSTRDNGKVNMQFPSTGQMNGVDVLAVDTNQVYILDASLKFQSSQNPPFNVLNRNAFLLQEGNMSWVWIDDDRSLLKQVIQVNAIVKENGGIEGKAYGIHYDYAKSYILDTTIEEKEEDRHYDKKPQGVKIVTMTRENEEDDSKPLLQTSEFTYETPQTGEFYFINPQFLSSQKENPFVKEKRNTDIDFGCKQELILRLNLSIPANFQLDFVPKNIIVRAPDTSFIFRRTVYVEKETIALHQSFEIKSPIFYKEDYPSIREFFQRVYTLMNEEIVLKRKK